MADDPFATAAGCRTCSGPIRETVGMVCQTCGTDYASAAKTPGPDHSVALLDGRKVEAFVLLLGWPRTTVVVHACEARFELAKEWAT